ncbi:UNVERIFIED_CONTAM: hypothetical protein GTU68_058675, partial [Idotea baltica]|nr:hypothetical protein [Idotea baltica]
EKIKEIEARLPDTIKLAFLPNLGTVKLRITGKSEDPEQIEQEVRQFAIEMESILEKHCIGKDNESLEEVIGNLLVAENATLATAESCTGGLIASKIVSVSGASRYFQGSVVAYSYEVKEQVLKVKKDTLTKNGAVSQEVVEEMVAGVIELMNVDYAIAVSGIAGPGGATDDKPVGTFWIAVGSKSSIVAKRLQLTNHRDINIPLTANLALNELRKLIKYPIV